MGVTIVQEFLWAAEVGQHFNTVIPNDLLTQADHDLLKSVHMLDDELPHKTADAFEALLRRVEADPRTTKPAIISTTIPNDSYLYQIVHEG